MKRLPHLLLIATFALFALSSAAQAAPRAFVASYGNDSNTASSCSLAAPCRSFQAALSVMAPPPGPYETSEIIALDSAGYGPVAIDRSITITANPGVYAGISAAAGSAITISTAADRVTLRNLHLSSAGASDGIIGAGVHLNIENCTISGFGAHGVYVARNGARVTIMDSVIRGNQIGVWVENAWTFSMVGSRVIGNTNTGVFVWSVQNNQEMSASITDSFFANNTGAISLTAGNNALILKGAITRSTVTGNMYGIQVAGTPASAILALGSSSVTGNGEGLSILGGTVRSIGNSIIDLNEQNVVGGTITTVPAQ